MYLHTSVGDRNILNILERQSYSGLYYIFIKYYTWSLKKLFFIQKLGEPLRLDTMQRPLRLAENNNFSYQINKLWQNTLPGWYFNIYMLEIRMMRPKAAQCLYTYRASFQLPAT